MSGRPVHEHGNYLRYLHGPDEWGNPGRPCRCDACRAAETEKRSLYRTRKARERWGAEPSLMVDADTARAHVRSLMASGIPRKTIAKLAQVTDGCVARLLYGEPSTTPPTPPTVRMTRRNAEKLLAVRFEDALALDGYVDAAGTRRRLQALVALGWPQSELARRLGLNSRHMNRFIASKRVSTDRARQVRALYGQMWDTAPPEENGYQRRDTRAARARARREGWPLPGAWDDDLIDLPEEDLARELERRAAAMDDDELGACYRARYKLGDISPLIVAGAREYARRRYRAEAS